MKNLLSPCCQTTIVASRGDGVTMGSCSACNKTVCRVNPTTGKEEWLDGNSPWIRSDYPLRLIEEAQGV